MENRFFYESITEDFLIFKVEKIKTKADKFSSNLLTSSYFNRLVTLCALFFIGILRSNFQ